MRASAILLACMLGGGALLSFIACGNTSSPERSAVDSGADADAGSISDAGVDAPDEDGGDAPPVIEGERWFAFVNVPQTGEQRAELFAVQVGASASATAISIAEGLRIDTLDSAFFRWAPVGTRVAFTSDRDSPDNFNLYVADPSTSAPPKQINTPTTAPLGITFYRWSADATRLAFNESYGASASIYVYDFDTDEIFVVSDGPDEQLEPLRGFSPSGKHIVFAEGGSLKVTNLDTKATSVLLTAVGNVAEDFTWTADSSRFVFRTNPESSPRKVYSVDFSGPQPGSPIERSGTVSVADVFPAAPAGTLVPFTGVETTLGYGLYVVDAAGAEPAVRVSGSVDFDSWSIAPDGQRIILSSAPESALYVWSTAQPNPVHASGAAVVYVEGTSPQTLPTWWPDAKHVQFLAETAISAKRELRLLDALQPAAEPTTLVSDHAFWHSVSPDGRWVTYSAVGGQWALMTKGANPQSQELSAPVTATTNRAVWSSDSAVVAYAAKLGTGKWHYLANGMTGLEPTPPILIGPEPTAVDDVHCLGGSWGPL